MHLLLLCLATVVLTSSHPTSDPCKPEYFDSVLVAQLSKDIVSITEKVYTDYKSGDEMRMYHMILDVGSALDLPEKQRVEQIAVMSVERKGQRIEKDTIYKARQAVYLFEYLTKNLHLLGIRHYGVLRKLITYPYNNENGWKKTTTEEKEALISKLIFSEMCKIE